MKAGAEPGLARRARVHGANPCSNELNEAVPIHNSESQSANHS